MSVSGGSNRAVYVRMEKIDPGGLTTNRGWTIEEDERVAARLTETWGKGWEEHGYRLAYGVLKGLKKYSKLDSLLNDFLFHVVIVSHL